MPAPLGRRFALLPWGSCISVGAAEFVGDAVAVESSDSDEAMVDLATGETAASDLPSSDDTGGASPPVFANQEPAFIDFGCGTGESIRFGESLMRKPSFGIDINPDRVAHCRDPGLDAAEADVLTFAG